MVGATLALPFAVSFRHSRFFLFPFFFRGGDLIGPPAKNVENPKGRRKAERIFIMSLDLTQTIRYIHYLAPDKEKEAVKLLMSLPIGWEGGIPRQCRYVNDGISKLAIAHAVLEILVPGTTAPSHAVRILAIYIHELYKQTKGGEAHEG